MKKKKMLPFAKYLIVVDIIVTLITIVIAGIFKMLPLEYLGVLIIFLTLVTIGLIILILSKNIYRNTTGVYLSLIYIVLIIMFIIYKFSNLSI